jgi:hypothetical protein
MRAIIPCLLVILAAEAHGNTWTRLDKATITGQRWDIPLGYSPELKRFLILGGRTSWGEYRKPRPYDVLTLNPKTHEWDNSYPADKEWGPLTGACKAPAWKGELWEFRDVEGNVRPNWTVYGTFSLGQKYDYDPDTKCFFFHARGKTFRYDPAARTWTDLAPKTTPESALGGNLLWSSMCYEGHNKRFVLFGGGNVQSERGDPGTWTYSRADNVWKQLDLDVLPPRPARSTAVRHLGLRRRQKQVGAAQAESVAVAARRPCAALAAESEEGPPPRRLRLHLHDRLRGRPLQAAAAGSVDVRSRYRRMAARRALRSRQIARRPVQLLHERYRR